MYNAAVNISFIIFVILAGCNYVYAKSVLYYDFNGRRLLSYSIDEGIVTELTILPGPREMDNVICMLFVERIAIVEGDDVLISGYGFNKENDYQEYSGLLDLGQNRLEQISDKMMVTDIKGNNFIGMHTYGYREHFKKHPFFYYEGIEDEDIIIEVSCLDPFNLHIVEKAGALFKRLTSGYGYYSNPRYYDYNSVVYFTHDGKTGRIGVMDRERDNKTWFTVEERYLEDDGQWLGDLDDWCFDVYEDTILISNEHFLFGVNYKEENGSEVRVGEDDLIYSTDDPIMGITVDEKGRIYMVVSADEFYYETYLIEYDLTSSSVNVIEPGVCIHPPIAVID